MKRSGIAAAPLPACRSRGAFAWGHIGGFASSLAGYIRSFAAACVPRGAAALLAGPVDLGALASGHVGGFAAAAFAARGRFVPLHIGSSAAAHVASHVGGFAAASSAG